MSRDEGKHYSFLRISKLGIFRDHVAPPDFAENTDMAEDLDYTMGLDFWEHFFFFKNPRLIGGLIRYLCDPLTILYWLESVSPLSCTCTTGIFQHVPWRMYAVSICLIHFPVNDTVLAGTWFSTFLYMY